MWNPATPFSDAWKAFSSSEKRNIVVYTVGIMLCKLGLDSFNGSVIALAIDRFDHDAIQQRTPPMTFRKVGVMVAIHHLFQCIGSLVIAPMIGRFPAKNVLSVAVIIFGLLTAGLLILDKATGGRMTATPDVLEYHKGGDCPIIHYYGHYPTEFILLFFSLCGFCQGMVELIRRAIPREIVGSDDGKLRRMEALVHIFYTLAGAVGAFMAASVVAPSLGNNFAFIGTPISFGLAAIPWFFLKLDINLAKSFDAEQKPTCNLFRSVLKSFVLFAGSVCLGAKLVFTHRKYIWLLPCFSGSLFGHNYLETAVAPIITRRYLGHATWSLLMIGGSNIGQLLGGVSVFAFSGVIRTPLPWLRLELLIPFFLWYLPWWNPSHTVTQAWLAAASFIPMSFGWAAGDISLAAYIQASSENHMSTLAPVMAFLYCIHLGTYAVATPFLGREIDKASYLNDGNVRELLGGLFCILLTSVFAVTFWSTFIPKGAVRWNPKTLFDEQLDLEEENADEMTAG